MGDYIDQVIRDKKRWHRTLTAAEEQLGFRGWRSRGYLPHFDFPSVRQFLTWRLADSLPGSLRGEWGPILKIADERERRIRIEEYLDRGRGECHLRDERIAAVVEKNLCHGDGDKYRLLAWVVMPNHVHALAEMATVPLEVVLHGWKSYTAKAANAVLGCGGRFWQPEYFDRFIRDEEHFWKALRYIENNPVKAGLAKTPEEWRWSSSRYREWIERSADGSSA